MCSRCVRAAYLYFPDVPDGRLGEFLFSATCFPFGDHAAVERNLADAWLAGCETYQQAEAYADEQMEDAMKRRQAAS